MSARALRSLLASALASLAIAAPARAQDEDAVAAASATGLSYTWTFQDGTPALWTDATPPGVTFASVGEKTVTLTVCDIFLHCSTSQQTVTVRDPSPTGATASATPTIALRGEVVALHGFAEGQSPLVFTWTTPEGLLVGQDAGWNTAATVAGTYTVALAVSNVGASKALNTVEVVVRPGFVRDWRAVCDTPPCSADPGDPVSFVLETGPVAIAQYEYDWNGDGTYEETATRQLASWRYAAPGVFHPRVRLTLTDGSSEVFVTDDALTIRAVDNGYLFGEDFEASGDSSRWSASAVEPPVAPAPSVVRRRH